MKKLNITLLTLLLPLASAQAQSSVTIYGVLDTSISLGNGGGGASTVSRLDSGVGPGSRLGFRGEEGLDGGLSAQFTLEMGIGSDTGTSQQGGALFGRQAFVGLGSNKGWRVTLGRQYSPTMLSIVAADAQGQIYWGSTVGLGQGVLQSPGSAVGTGCHSATARINNSVMGSWSGAGLTGRLMVGAGDENDRKTGQLLSPSLSYSTGPLMLTAAYTRFHQCAADIAASAAPAWQSEATAGGSFDFTVLKLFAGYYTFNPSEENKTVTATTMLKSTAYWVGARVPVGPAGMLITQAIRQKYDRTASSAKGYTLALTYEHSLSKRTRLYASAARTSNDDAASFGINGATAAQAATQAGADPRVLSLGISHWF